jgi:electron transport complex protein RnfC
MRLLTFKKGVHPPHGKHFTENKSIETYVPKGNLVFPMSQHIGAPCEPTVKKGDRVLVGQKIGEAKGFVSAPIYSSVSGTVKDVALLPHSSGTKVLSVVIENDYQNELSPAITSRNNYSKLSKEELLKIIQEAGIVGMGGAGFPTHVKLSPPPDKKIDSIIVNGAECEPYLTCDHRLMLENTKEIVDGLKIILQMFPDAKGYIAIENNKPDALLAMRKAVKDVGRIEVVALQTKYPQGAEKQLIYAVTKREVPSGKLPADTGCIVQNVGTVYEIYNAVVNGQPLIERIVTITGEAVKEPKNLRVKLGTSFKELVEACGGFREQAEKIISGGPLMGTTVTSLELPVMKGTSGILCLTKKQAVLPEESSCIRCAKCVDACPMNLVPSILNSYSIRREYELFEENNGMDCIECGCCSLVCPAKRHLTQSCREGKRTILARRKKAN